MLLQINNKQLIQLKNKIQKGLIYSLIFSTFSGAIRKWIVSSSAVGNIVLLFQLLLPFYFAFFLWNSHINSPFKKYKILSFYLALLILLGVNPMNQSIMHGVLGVILHFGFWFMILFYCANKEYFEIDRFIKIALVFCAIELVLGLIQYSLPVSHFLNKYADNDRIKNIATVGDRVRITGTFSYLGGIGSFLLFQIFLLWSAFRKNTYPRISLLLIFGGFLTALMTGSRSTSFTYFLFFILLIFVEYRNLQVLRRVIWQVPAMLCIILFGIVFLGDKIKVVEKVSVAWDNFNGRVQRNRSSGEEEKRILDPIFKTINFDGNYPLIGVGLGATYQGATTLFGTSKYVTDYGYVEEEWERLVLEGGFVLFFFRIALFITLFRSLSIPTLPKIVILSAVFVFIPIVIQTYNAFFLAFGLICLDRTYYKKNSLK